ncbi:DUF58 domain-containing protein [Ideonella sp.]|uniref:DUF58 domain-containing protein n=1 Tax=Ideonella sp. TaxID=1929293 RepID=UPI002B48B122|nr:DUF58 domain-containing protein [Ideonella sp.]HJV72081.1 DUF58 domain-containing protein [Ideonella sp.]
MAAPDKPPAPIRELHYRVDAPVLGHFPGHHRSRRGDSGFEFRGHASLLDAPDPRRLDLHASLRDPFGNWMVRVYSQRKSIPVVVIADLSASMGFEGARRKLDVLADFVDSLAWSAWRTGDSFGFIGCDAEVRADFLQPATRARGVGSPLAQRLREWQPDERQGRSAQGLLAAQRYLGRQRALVFLVSDFHLPPRLISDVLGSLAHHDVVPVVLWDPAEFGLSAPRGLAQVVDPETGRQRLVWWRPALRTRWQQHHQARHDALQQLFRARRLKPLFIEGGFDAEAVTRHFT